MKAGIIIVNVLQVAYSYILYTLAMASLSLLHEYSGDKGEIFRLCSGQKSGFGLVRFNGVAKADPVKTLPKSELGLAKVRLTLCHRFTLKLHLVKLTVKPA